MSFNNIIFNTKTEIILLQAILLAEKEDKGVLSIFLDTNRTADEGVVFVWKSPEIVTKAWEVEKCEYCHKGVTLDLKLAKEYPPQKRIFLTDKDVVLAEEKLHSLGINKGETYISKQGDFYRLLKTEIVERTDGKLMNDHKRNPHREIVPADEIWHTFAFNETTERVFQDDSKEIGALELLPTGTGASQFLDKMADLAVNGVESFRETIMLGDDGATTTTDLVGVASKEHMKAMVEVATEKRNTAELLRRGLTAHTRNQRRDIEKTIAEQMEAVELVKKFVEQQLAVLTRKMAQMVKLIVTLELYAGINEDVVQIIDGEKSLEETIHIRQKTIFLDEEIALFGDQGLEWNDIETFDKWLYTNEMYKELLPEEKCVVCARVRRKSKNMPWIENPFIRAMAEARTNHALLLFRNGDNVYRIWSEHLDYTERLYPTKAELQANYNNINKHYEELNESDERYRDVIQRRIEDEEDEMFPYKKNILMLHGILTRTDILGEAPLGFSLMKPDTHGTHVKYISDAENVIGSGLESYDAWLTRVNSTLKNGCRIFLASETLSSHGGSYYRDWEDRYTQYFGEHNHPNLPSSGVYSVKNRKEQVRVRNQEELRLAEVLKLKDMGDVSEITDSRSIRNDKGEWEKMYTVTRYHEDGSDIKYEEKEVLRITYNRETYRSAVPTSFIVKPYDKFLINIDGVELSELDHHISNKEERKNYLKMMPVLKQVREIILEEKGKEDVYAEAMAGRIAFGLKIVNRLEQVKKAVENAIKWYKLEIATVHKRALPTEGKDVAKAWAMVELNTKRTLKKELKLNIDVSGIEKGTFAYTHVGRLKTEENRFKSSKETVTVEANSRKDAVQKLSDLMESMFYTTPSKTAIRENMVKVS